MRFLVLLLFSTTLFSMDNPDYDGHLHWAHAKTRGKRRRHGFKKDRRAYRRQREQKALVKKLAKIIPPLASKRNRRRKPEVNDGEFSFNIIEKLSLSDSDDELCLRRVSAGSVTSSDCSCILCGETPPRSTAFSYSSRSCDCSFCNSSDESPLEGGSDLGECLREFWDFQAELKRTTPFSTLFNNYKVFPDADSDDDNNIN